MSFHVLSLPHRRFVHKPWVLKQALAQFFAEGGEAVEITDEQRELFAKWSTLTEKQKALLLEFISTLQ